MFIGVNELTFLAKVLKNTSFCIMKYTVYSGTDSRSYFDTLFVLLTSIWLRLRQTALILLCW